MKVLYDVTLNNLKLNKRRTIVTIIGIVLATFLMVGVGIVFSSFRQTTINSLINDYGEYHVYFDSLSNKEIEQINSKYFVTNVKGIKEYSKVKNVFYDLYNSEDLIINSANDDYLNSLKLISGRLPENSGEIIIAKDFNSFLNNDYKAFKVGDTITLSLGDGSRNPGSENTADYEEKYQESLDNFIVKEEKTYKIVGIYDNNVLKRNISNAFFVKEEMDSYSVYVTFDNIKDTLDDTKIIVNELDLTKDDYSYNEPFLALYGVSTLKRNSFYELIYVFLFLILTLISLGVVGMIYNSFLISMSERKKWLGMLSSIGASKKQIYISVLFEALIVGTIGIVIGIILSLVGMKFFIWLINILIKKSGAQICYSVYPSFVIIPTLFMILVILLASSRPASIASKTSIIERIRLNDDIKIKSNKVKGNRLIKKILGTEGDISYKNMKRNKKKYKMTVISLSLSVILFISSYSIIDFLFGGVENFYSNKYDYTLSIESNDLTRLNEIVSRLKNTGEVKDIVISSNQVMGIKTVDYSDYYTNDYKDYLSELKKERNVDSDYINVANIFVMDDDSFRKYVKENNLKENEAILYNFFTDTISYRDGRTRIFDGEIYKNNNMTFEFCYSSDRIETVNCNNDLESYQLSSAYFLGAPEAPQAYTFVVNDYLFSKLDTSKILYESNTVNIRMNVYDDTKIDNEVLGLFEEGILTNDSSYYNIKGEMEGYNNTILAVKIGIYSVSLMIALIGATSIFNTINANINLRKKEFATLRSVGMSNKMFNKMVCLEGVFLAFKSLLYSIPISLIIHYLLFLLNGEMVGTSKFEIPYFPIVLSIVMVFLVVVTTIYYASNKIKKSNIIDTIREDNI